MTVSFTSGKPRNFMMTFSEALRYLYSFVSYERKVNWTYSNKTLNLERFKDFLHHLGDPQNGFRSIHVAGSDGKGSVCAMIESVLRASGYKTGLYSSPHLQNIRERIRIGESWIPEADFAQWTEFLRERTASLPPLPEGYATFFERITAMAFLHFQKEQADFAVVETGMGGRLDATNVMNPCLTVITHISLEHTEQLGNTLEAIADEKLGIIRPGVPVIIGRQDESLYPHFQERLRDHSAPVIFADRQYSILSEKPGRTFRTLSIREIDPPSSPRTIRIPLFGHYQIQNTVTALAALDSLAGQDILPKLTPQSVKNGFRDVEWPGRFERFRGKNGCVIILDVAHTAKGAISLRLSLDERYPKRKRIFVMGFLQGKNIREMLRHLIRPQDTLILTQAPSPRGTPLEAIRPIVEELPETAATIHWCKEPREAFSQATRDSRSNDLLCVAGSLYLVGEIRTLLKPVS